MKNLFKFFAFAYVVSFSTVVQASSTMNGTIYAPSSAVIGDTVTVSGSFTKKVKRPVELQKKFKSYWKRIAKKNSGGNGTYNFPVLVSSTQTYRVYAAQTQVKRVLYGAVFSRSKKITANARPKSTQPPTSADNPSPPVTRCSFEPCSPLNLATGEVVSYEDSSGHYWAFIPGANEGNTSDAPLGLLIWLHGCGGNYGDLWGAADYYGYRCIAIAPDGAENDCWDMSRGTDRVLATIQSAVSHFKINQHRVIIGGYSSGGDLAYRAAFLHAEKFAGVLAINTSPYRDKGTSASVAQASAWKFHVFHVLSQNDATYPSAGVNNELNSLQSLGFDVRRQVIPGATHYDEPSNPNNPSDGTFYNFQHYLIEGHMNDGWISP